MGMSHPPSFEGVGFPRPVIAYALYGNGQRREILGWTQLPGETLMEALERTAKLCGAQGYEVELTAL